MLSISLNSLSLLILITQAASILATIAALATPIESNRANTGDHRMEGIFLLCGTDFVSRQDAPIELNIEDIAPTVLHLMGLPVPSDMDGRVATEVYRPDWVAAHPINVGEPMQYWPSESEALSHDQAITPRR